MTTLSNVLNGIDDNVFLNEDCVSGIKEIPNDSIHLILSDIPYGIGAEEWDVMHDNQNSAYLGSSPAQKVAGAVFKKRGKPLNGWSEADKKIPYEYYDWCKQWASDWYRILKPGGTAFIFAGRRLSHRCAAALEDAGFTFKDSLCWLRQRAPHRAQRLSVVYDRRGDEKNTQDWEGWRIGNLRPIYEPILWFTKPYKIGTTVADNVLMHGVGAYNQDAFLKYVREPDNILDCGFTPKENKIHPTQKPLLLMQALIELATQRNQIVLDPFAGSGSTLVAAEQLGRKYIGFENNHEYFNLAQERLGKVERQELHKMQPALAFSL
ncbi:MAG: site-specific DNA-methyltransferase [Patescibacteria group bacterium]